MELDTSYTHRKFPTALPHVTRGILKTSRLPPCLEELVDMQQTDAGGRMVMPRDHKEHEGSKSIGSCIL